MINRAVLMRFNYRTRRPPSSSPIGSSRLAELGQAGPRAPEKTLARVGTWVSGADVSGAARVQGSGPGGVGGGDGGREVSPPQFGQERRGFHPERLRRRAPGDAAVVCRGQFAAEGERESRGQSTLRFGQQRLGHRGTPDKGAKGVAAEGPESRARRGPM